MQKLTKLSGKVSYREEQRYGGPGLFIAIAVGGILPIVVLYILMEMRRGITMQQFTIAVPVVLVICCVNIGFLLTTRLETIVSDTGVHVRWIPFHKRYLHFRWEEMSEGFLTKFVPPSGLPGAKVSTGWSYKIQSSIGIRLLLKSGKELFLGSERPQKLRAEIERFVPITDQLKNKK